MNLKLEFSFDNSTFRHFINGEPVVLHCHHYMTLTTKLAEDCAHLGGVRHLMESAEDAMRKLFDSYFQKEKIDSPEDRLDLACQYYAAMGLGKMEATGSGEEGDIKLIHSHIDEGWIKKFGRRTTPANYFTCGYVAAMFAAAFNQPPRSYQVEEKSSIVCGAANGLLLARKVK
jgi:hypothetical protein